MPGEVVRAQWASQQVEPDLFRVISPDAWQGRSPPRRDWMVEDCFLRGTVGMISGDGGIGKSLIVQQLANLSPLSGHFKILPRYIF